MVVSEHLCRSTPIVFIVVIYVSFFRGFYPVS
jgi:hypothetical protein